jgi:hypothetical protein
MMFCLIRYKPNIFFWQYSPLYEDVFQYCLVFRHLDTKLYAFLIFHMVAACPIHLILRCLILRCIKLITEFMYTIISGYCQSYSLTAIGTLLSSTQILYSSFKAAFLCSFVVALLIPFRRILANSQKNPAAYIVLHLFIIDQTRFGLNGHHQGSQQSHQETSRSLYFKM